MFGSAGMQVASLYAKLGADTKDFERAMRNADGVIGKTGATLGVMAKVGVGAVVAGLGALTGGLTASLGAASEFDKVMSGAKAVLGATAEEMTALNDKAQQLGKDTSFSAKEAALAIEMLAKNGLTASQILEGAADATVALAAATGADLATAADIATDAMMQFDMTTDDLTKAINGISGVVVSSKFDINDYALALAQAGGVAGKIGVSFTDFNTAIAATSSSFASGSDAGTSFKTFLQRLPGISGPAIEALAALGIISADGSNQFYDAAGNMKSMAEIAGVLQRSVVGLNDEVKNKLFSEAFGTDAIRTALGLADVGAEGFSELAKRMSEVDAAAQALTRLDNLAGDLEQLSGSFETLRIKIGQAFTPLARKAVQALTSNLNKLLDLDYTKFANRFEKVFELIASPKIGAMIQSLSLAFVDFGKVLVKVSRPLRDAFGGLFNQILAVSGRGSGAMFNTLVIGLLDMAKALGQTLISNLALFIGQWRELGKAIVQWVQPQIPALLSALGSLLTTIGGWVTDTALPVISEKIKEWGGALYEWVEPQIPLLKEKLRLLWNSVTSWITDANKRQTLIDTLFEWGAAFATWAGTLWATHIRPGLLSAWGWVSSWVTDSKKRKLLVDKLVDWASAFGSWAMNLWKNYIVPGVDKAWSELSSWVTDSKKRTKLLGWLNDTWTGFTEWAAGVWGNIKPKLDELLATVNEWIASNNPNLKSWIDTISSFFSGMSGQFETELPTIQKRWVDFVDKISSELERIAGAFGLTFGPTGAASAFGKFFTNVLITIGDVFLTLVESMLVKLRVLAESFATFGTIGSAIMAGDMAAVWAGIQDLGSAIAGFGDVWKVWADLIGRVGDRFNGNANDGAGVREFGGRSMEAPPLVGVTNAAPLMGDIYITIDGNVATDRAALRDMAEEISRQIWRKAELAGMRLA